MNLKGNKLSFSSDMLLIYKNHKIRWNDKQQRGSNYYTSACKC